MKNLVKLSLMMFLQNMIFPVWFNTIIPYVETVPGGKAFVPFCGALMGIGMFASPVVCMFADRFLDSGKVLALCNLLAAVTLGAASVVKDPVLLFALLVASTICLMPTWSVVAAIAMAHAPTSSFPYIRAFGSVGWAASAVFSVVAIRWLGIADFDKSPYILSTAAAVSLASSLVALAMPPTPPKAKGERFSVADALGLGALSLLKNRSFLFLSLLALLAMVPFQWYMAYNTKYLDEAGFKYLSLTQNLGQVAELGFMLLLPILFRRLSFRNVLLVGLSALVFRYVCFATAVATGVHAFDFGGILVHGLIFGVLIVAFQMHAAEIAPPELRNQAQGFVMLLTAGIGTFVSVGVFNAILCHRPGVHDWSLAYHVALGISVLAVILALFMKNEAKKQD